MANQEHLDILAKGVETWNAWRKNNPSVRPDLQQVVLSKANLTYADLNGADLRSAELSGAELNDAILTIADLAGANLSRAFLSGAHLGAAILTDANLSNADLPAAVLNSASLKGAMFRFSWKWRRRSPSKVMERTHEEATEALHARREGRHSEAASA